MLDSGGNYSRLETVIQQEQDNFFKCQNRSSDRENDGENEEKLNEENKTPSPRAAKTL
jgi:hypothetical protein